MQFNKVFLTGFMTSGKSTLGPILANVLGWNFYDLDRVIEKEEKMAVVDIFKEKGEKYFRDKETRLLTELVTEDNIIIALGGGTITNQVNVDLLRNNGKLIYLKVTPEVLYQRLKHKIDRPLFRDLVLSENPKDDFIIRITELLDEREKYYSQADIVIDCDSRKVGITVDQLAHKLNKMKYEKNRN